MKKNKETLFAFLALIIAFLILILFYGSIIKDPGKSLFANSGDGLKNYFGSYYHMKYDDSYLHTKSQNFPYGESVFYCDSQPFLTNNLLLLKKFGFDYTENIIAITNLLMLFSIVIGSLFIYLLLRRFNLPIWYSIIVANIIAFLSPQIDRMGGHFSLAYVFFIPMYLYLLHWFYTNRSIMQSFFLGIVTFIGLTTHAYYFAFFGILSLFILVVLHFFEKEKFPLLKVILPNFAIQIIIPFILFQFFTIGIPNDRTSYPWGFFETRAFPESVFLPVGKPYAKFLHFGYLKWEGIAFIGMVATLIFLIGIVYHFRNIKKRNWFRITENTFLNAALWASLIALFFSFAYPFQWYLEWLWNYMGPLKQFRASGRFNWLFFYVINILAFYLLWEWYKLKKTKVAFLVIVGALIWGSYDAYLNARHREHNLNNEIVELSDAKNELKQNNWINNIDVSSFQAILPFPFFHIGSEVYWYGDSNNSIRNAFVVSWKTGLPINAVLLGRTSISQTLKSLALVQEPLSSFKIVDDYKSDKDFLLLVQKGEIISENENRFINYSMLLAENEFYSVYRLPFEALIKLPIDYKTNVFTETENKALISNAGFVLSDSASPFIYQSFGNVNPELERIGTTYSTNATKESLLLDTLLFDSSEPIKLSFWMKDLDKDLFPRSMINLLTKKKDGNYYSHIRTSIFKFVKYINSDGWGLVELEYLPTESNEQLRIVIWNDLVTGGYLEFDDILVMYKHQNVYYRDKDFVYKNNRFLKN